MFYAMANRDMKYHYLLYTVCYMLLIACDSSVSALKIDSQNDWLERTGKAENVTIEQSNDLNGVVDLMGNGGLMLAKRDGKKPFQKTSEFNDSGTWSSDWQVLNGNSIRSIESEVIAYGNDIDMRSDWVKFSGNPVVSGENTLLPLNKENITDQTILLPAPGGVPQDQSILKGTGQWEGKWLLFFNHTPDKWPNDYYWSFAVADSLSPLKRGQNPFYIDDTAFPLYGPIDGQAPNDWLEVDGKFYAPDETHGGESHMWLSEDIINWQDLGPITGILGADPGMVYDGQDFFLFNENGDYLTYNQLDESLTNVIKGDTVLHVGDHTGDPDIGFFNNQWHMFFDDGAHLHYNIGYAVTSPEGFPYGWKLENDIYGPYNPNQGQTWDNDNKEGNDFGTGDADIAIENNTIYLFTERPIGAAYRDLKEIYENTGQQVKVKVEIDENGDDLPDKSSGWLDFQPGKHSVNLKTKLQGKRYRLLIKLSTANTGVSPLVRYIKIE